MSSYPDYLLGLIRKRFISVLIIALVVALAYGNIFSNSFAWDDKDTILNWEATRSWNSIPAMLLGATPPGHPGNYRPVRNILYIVSYHLWGTSTWGYHMQTIALASGISILVYFITRKLYPNGFVPLLTALFFGTHPLHVEALTWMTSMMDMFGMLFGFASVYTFLIWRDHPKRLLVYLVSWVLMFLGIFSNEIAFAFPLLIAFILVMFPKKGQSILLSVPFGLIVPVNFAIRMGLLGIGSRFTYIGDNFGTTMIVMSAAMLTYFRLLVFPSNLTINHDLGNGLSSWSIELLDPLSVGHRAVQALSVTTPSVLISWGILAVLFFSAVYFRKKSSWVTFSIGWFCIAMIPVSNLLPTEAILTERFIFLASYGFCLLLASFVSTCANLLSLESLRSRVAWISIVGILIFYVSTTLARNAEWESDRTLWTTATTRNPNAFIAHVSLANYYYARGNVEQALNAYLTARSINPTPEDISLYIAAMYYALGKNNEAIIYLNRILKKNPWNIEAYFRLGNLYKGMGQLDKAVATYQTALKIYPSHTQIRNNLGVTYAEMGLYDDAEKEFKTALSYDPNYQNAKQNLNHVQSGSLGPAAVTESPPLPETLITRE